MKYLTAIASFLISYGFSAGMGEDLGPAPENHPYAFMASLGLALVVGLLTHAITLETQKPR